jgi:hypothetical protein
MSAAQPWMKFYPRDWRGDQALRVVSLAARGLWIECLSIMHEATPYGHLVVNGKAVDDGMLARLVGASAEDVQALRAELIDAGVANQNRGGILVSRRMVRDQSRAKKGRKAAQKRWGQDTEKSQENGKPNGLPTETPITQKPEARSQRRREDKPPSRVDLPDWVPREEWDGFKAMRARQKKPLTLRAEQMALADLEKLRAEGNDPAAVLRQSEFKCWLGLFPLKVEEVKRTERDLYAAIDQIPPRRAAH